VNTAPPKAAQTTLAILGKLLGTLLIWAVLLHTTDMSGISALITASAISGAVTLYLYKTIPLVLAGKKSLGSVAQDMLTMADKLDQMKTGEIKGFRSSAQALTESVESATTSLGLDTPSSPSTSPITQKHWPESLVTSSPPPTQSQADTTLLRVQLAEAASLMEMGYGIEAAAMKTGVPHNVLERLERSGNGEWITIKRDAHDHLLRRIGDVFR
jgi:hypothetical protein